MIQETYTELEKREIAQRIKPITLEEVQEEYNKLKQIGLRANLESGRSRVGNNWVDFFTFQERLNTRGKYGISFYDFLANMKSTDKENPLQQKKFIQNMLKYYRDVKNKNQTKNEYKVYKEVYNICVSAINVFRPLMAMEIYARFKPKTVLDFTCGWGGRLLGACILDVPKYIGIDSNINLLQPYNQMYSFLKKQPGLKTEIEMYFEDALQFDYSKIKYDMVFTSPPYYDLEVYSHQPAILDLDTLGNKEIKEKEKKEKKKKKDSLKHWMNEHFYKPLFQKTYEFLEPGGVYALNINQEIYETVCLPLWGEAQEKIALKKSQRQNQYGEYIYIFSSHF
jgi:16S rRNA G966 N2-methylase RsmD